MGVEKLRVVFDCMIYLQAVVTETGLAAKLFDLLDDDAFILFTSPEILNEVQDVLNRPKLRKKYSQITDNTVEAFLQRVSQKAILIKHSPPKFKYSRDPKDEKYIDVAVESQAGYLVSNDNDLLDLMTGVDDDSKQFRQKFRPLKIMSSSVFLEELENHD